MNSFSKSRSHSRRSAGVLLLVGILAGVSVGGGVGVNAASPSKAVTWKVTSLKAGQVKRLSALVSTNSPGVKTWSKKGTCTLTPKRKPTKLVMGSTGTCKLTLKIAKSGNYPAKTVTRVISLLTAASSTTSTVAPTVTTIAPATTVAVTCAAGGVCAVGNTGPGGGTVFYVASSNFTSTGSACNTTCRYLEAAPIGWIKAETPAAQVNCSTPGTVSTDPKCEWSGNTSSLIGTTATAIGSGYENTSKIISQNSTAGKAATVARAFQGGGKTDWSLPSKNELSQMFLKKSEIGGFDSGFYWNSSEATAQLAETWDFDFGYSYEYAKNGTNPVRPVRAF